MKYLIALLLLSGNAMAGAWFVGDKVDVTTSGKIPALQVNSCKNLASDLTVGTTGAHDTLIQSNGLTRLYILSGGQIGFGATPSTGNSFEFASTNNGSANSSSIFSTMSVTGAGATQQQGVYAAVHSSHDTGTVSLLRNYFTAEHSGDGTVTETYGARAITRLFDNNAPGDTSAGIIGSANGLEAYANNTSTGGGIIRNATGVRISHAKATGTDGGNTHNAVGLLIEDDIVASGGSTNTAYAIDSQSTAKSVFAADIEILNNKPLILVDSTSKTYSISSPDSLAASLKFVLPATAGSNGDCIKTNGSGVLSYGACGSGGSLNDLTNVTITAATNGQVLTYFTLTSKWSNATPSAGGGSGDVSFGGNAKTADASIGLTDAYKLSLLTNNTARVNITSAGIVTVNGNTGDFSTAPNTFGTYRIQTTDDAVPFSVFDNYFWKYGNTSNSKIGTLYNLSLNAGDPGYTYSGEYVGLRSNINVGASTYATAIATRGVVNSTYASSIINNATGILGEVTATGIVRSAMGLKVGTVSATAVDTSKHVAIGLDISPATESYAITASGSSDTNTAIGIRIGNTITGDVGLTNAIKSESVAPSIFYGEVAASGLRLLTGAEPTCNDSIGGKFWYVAGGVGVADTVKVCAKDASNNYGWRTIY